MTVCMTLARIFYMAPMKALCKWSLSQKIIAGFYTLERYLRHCWTILKFTPYGTVLWAIGIGFLQLISNSSFACILHSGGISQLRA